MKKSLLLFALSILTLTGFQNPGPSSAMVEFLREYLSVKYPEKKFNSFLYVAVKKQKMFLVEGDGVTAEYSISTAKKGIGGESGSFKIPPGLHKVAEKVGSGLDLYEIIKQKTPTGKKAKPVTEAASTGQDLITTRAIHLKGTEDGVNMGGDVDSYSRGIFIHGTHEEGLIGTPASKGCVRMRNQDIVELFERIEVGTFVIILNN